MTGQILAGSSPLVAIRYQMVVVFMLAAATALGSLLFGGLAAARYLTPAHQLRRYLLLARMGEEPHGSRVFPLDTFSRVNWPRGDGPGRARSALRLGPSERVRASRDRKSFGVTGSLAP